mmetsp:Transcript_31019/g.51867  ORF Transcript_31019/g.51867 Transcript_31019/m.51867 type:complete len:130 (-) Transcript_31019:1340-1729(-)
MDGGKVAEVGSHEELLENPESIYSGMWRMQTNMSGGFDSSSSEMTADGDEDDNEDGTDNSRAAKSHRDGRISTNNKVSGNVSAEDLINLTTTTALPAPSTSTTGAGIPDTQAHIDTIEQSINFSSTKAS